MTRRIFIGAIGSVCLTGEHLLLEAIAAEKMPRRLVVSGVATSPFFELRDYGSRSTQLIGILKRHGIQAVWEDGGRFLFPFDSLASRERGWREVSADPEWAAVGQSVVLRDLAVFKGQSVPRKGAKLAKNTSGLSQRNR